LIINPRNFSFDDPLLLHCWDKYYSLLTETIKWFNKKGTYYRVKPWTYKFIYEHTGPLVLDLGSGIASTSRHYLSKGIINRLILVDLACNILENIGISETRTIKICGDILDEIFVNKYFDTIYLFATLHNIPGRECRRLVLKRILEYLRSNGHAIITVWDPPRSALNLKYIVISFSIEYNSNDILLCNKNGLCRYYHLYRLEELLDDITYSGLKPLSYGVFYQGVDRRSLDLNKNIYVVVKKY
jgi:SAM-dependent methyltransferase